jgi:hypothetical protein
MTQRLIVALLTVAVFLAGFGARIWTEPRQPVPPVPAALKQDYVLSQKADSKSKRQLDRAKLVADIEKLRPQIIAYTARVDEIGTEFEREFLQLLTPAQREKFAAYLKRKADRDAKRLAERTPLSDEDIERAQDSALTSIYWMVTVNPRLEWLTKEFGLDAAQQTTTRSLLALRRNKFIALFDATPHPSIRLSRLAPQIERVAAPPK